MGLYNGSLGTIKALLFLADSAQQPVLLTCVLVEFNDYIGPTIVPGERIVPIIPETAVFDPRSGKTGSRIQLPLILGWSWVGLSQYTSHRVLLSERLSWILVTGR